MFSDKLVYKFVLPISALIFTSSIILSFIYIMHEANLLKMGLRERADSLTINLAYNSEYGALTKNYKILDELVNGVIEGKDVIWIEITDHQGEVLSSKGRKENKAYYQTEAAIMTQITDGNQTPFDEEIMFIEEQKEAVKGEKIGTVSLRMSLDNIYQEIKKISIGALGLTLVVISISIVGVFFMVGKVVSPIKKLLVATQKIRGGNLDVLSQVETKDEIGELSSSFNEMTQELKKSRAKIEDANQMLEFKVRERTNDLNHALSLISATLESTTDGILVIDRSRKISKFNQKFIKMWSVPDEVVISENNNGVFEFLASQLKISRLFVEKAEALHEKMEAENFDLLEFKDGKIFESYSMPQKMGEKILGRVWIFRDVTEKMKSEEDRKKLQETLHQSEKIAAVGQLAAGIAHEINNPMGVILGFAQGLSQRIKEGDLFEVPIKSIEREAKRCKNLVQDLLTFSRASASDRAPLDLNQTLEGVFGLMETQAKMVQVEMRKEFSEGLPRILGNSNQIQQVIINLVNNAFHAMPNGGILTITTELLNGRPQSWICLKVTDTGQGIPPEVLPRIFEPFFTTKPVGKGTGLGLSLIYEIIQKHSGTIEAKSQSGHTEFLVKFPVRSGKELEEKYEKTKKMKEGELIQNRRKKLSNYGLGITHKDVQ